MFLLSTGLPVAFSFLVVNLVAGYMVWGGSTGFDQLVDSVYSSVTMFALLPVPLFVIMGEVLLNSGLAFKSVDIVDKWLGRIPGRLGLVAVSSATIFSSLSGSSMGTTAMLGRILVPEMQTRGYKTPISIGSCMSGGLAMIIPPSALGVVLAAVAQVSVGKLLIAGVIPGLILASLYIIYIVGRCTLQPSLAPSYDPEPVPLSEKVKTSVKYLLPLVGIIILVIGMIFLGVATPTESAGIGAMITFVLAAIYGRFSVKLVKQVFTGTLRICIMMFMILTGSLAFSQLLAYTGATSGLVQFASALKIHPILLIFAMQFVILVLGTFMEQVAIMMITLPIFMPIVNAMGFDGVWFALIMLINLEIAMKSPPFGFLLFVMKSVAPKGTTMAQIYGATFPFILIDIIGMGLVIFFPSLAMWLPSFMTY
jgi:tripartite ATP-independent transporter DctM subunit